VNSARRRCCCGKEEAGCVVVGVEGVVGDVGVAVPDIEEEREGLEAVPKRRRVDEKRREGSRRVDEYFFVDV
jgi:hypothetical protein